MDPTRRAAADIALFFVLACGLTWALDLPLALAWIRHEEPPGYALALAGLSAWGPTLAAVAVAAPRRRVREVFGPWRTHPGRVLVALLAPPALHLVATGIEVALGGRPAQWFYPPVLPEHVAALVMFSLGEEFGWRGFAYPRLEQLAGPVLGSLILGSVWGLWHLVMLVTPEGALPTPLTLARAVVTLALWSVVMAWIFERGGRSMAVAIALHAGGHLDNVDRAPPDEVRLQVLRILVVAAAAALAAWALSTRRRAALTAPLVG